MNHFFYRHNTTYDSITTILNDGEQCKYERLINDPNIINAISKQTYGISEIMFQNIDKIIDEKKYITKAYKIMIYLTRFYAMKISKCDRIFQLLTSILLKQNHEKFELAFVASIFFEMANTFNYKILHHICKKSEFTHLYINHICYECVYDSLLNLSMNNNRVISNFFEDIHTTKQLMEIILPNSQKQIQNTTLEKVMMILYRLIQNAEHDSLLILDINEIENIIFILDNAFNNKSDKIRNSCFLFLSEMYSQHDQYEYSSSFNDEIKSDTSVDNPLDHTIYSSINANFLKLCDYIMNSSIFRESHSTVCSFITQIIRSTDMGISEEIIQLINSLYKKCFEYKTNNFLHQAFLNFFISNTNSSNINYVIDQINFKESILNDLENEVLMSGFIFRLITHINDNITKSSEDNSKITTWFHLLTNVHTSYYKRITGTYGGKSARSFLYDDFADDFDDNEEIILC
ncbi:hypothetical protein TRFO_14347 [Tritrichomonas foetus]|uniref:Uncharacterized protein n=1 Tax=Tritrichomonas foetus TaxID=1144522 RepID=A0A1J4KZZ5_9EUKA|nr:hypothetical protein TRFO_14347 [Tritrichomonas foetus]|eukprot:OHT15173.1 hypothetical protein TRFO_14347 [Tritrichomonas foetus]